MFTDRTKFIIYALGIFFCYFGYGIIQEKITRGRYGEEKNEDGTAGERFTYTLALVWVQCFCNWMFAKGMLVTRPQKEDTTHTGYYASCSLTYLLGMVSSNMALQWVPYPTQVVGKAAKPIPVMILGVLIGRKTYAWIKYACVLLIVLGVVLFMYKEGKGGVSTHQEKTGLGELLLFLSLAMDGLTGAVQDRMRAASAPSGQQMMLAMNWWTTMMLGAAIILTGFFTFFTSFQSYCDILGEGKDFIAFAAKHPSMLIHLATLALAGAIGQLFIFLMVSGYGPLACSVVTTTRKFFTVLCSVIIFGNVLNVRQWLGAALVFSGLFTDIMFGKKPISKKAPGAKHEEENNKFIS